MSLRRDGMSWALIIMLLFGAGVAAFYVVSPHLRPHTTLRLGDGVFSTDIVFETSSADKYLVRSRSLDVNQATLVVYADAGYQPVSVRSYHGLYDLVMLNKDKKVIHIIKNVNDSSADVAKRMADEPVKYVVELPQYTVNGKVITSGAVAVFDEHEKKETKL